MLNLDSFIVEFDKGLRAVCGAPQPTRPSPAQDLPEADLSPEERDRAAALMRVNHCGEVCAQALYQGQALSSGDAAVRTALARAAREEVDHLAWCETRIRELGGRASLLNPLWYAGSLAMGYAAGRMGDRWNLGFLAETEQQVEEHLRGHLGRLSPKDAKTRAVVGAMQLDEARHAKTAQELGAATLPPPVQFAMRLASRLMTSASYWV